MKFLIKQKIFSFGDSFTISDDQGNLLLKVKGKVFALSDKLKIYDMNDEEIYNIEQKLFKLLPEYRIFEGEEEVAFLKKEFTFFKPKLNIQSKHGNFVVEGNLWKHNFTITKDNTLVASVAKKLFAFSDTYTLDVADDEDAKFIVTLVIVIDQILHDNNKNNS